MKKISTIIFLFTITANFLNCRDTGNLKPQSRDSILINSSADSTALVSLVIKLLKWHESDSNLSMDFDVKKTSPADSIYSGIDWTVHKKRMTELSNTNFFTDSFLSNYHHIALYLDQELKSNKTKYREGDLPPYGGDGNEWCNCQDFPGDIWKNLKITDLKMNGDSANFKWNWGDELYYSVKTKKENGSWKISYLEGFDIKKFSW